jgi:ABC-type transporter MlaC component
VSSTLGDESIKKKASPAQVEAVIEAFTENLKQAVLQQAKQRGTEAQRSGSFRA